MCTGFNLQEGSGGGGNYCNFSMHMSDYDVHDEVANFE